MKKRLISFFTQKGYYLLLFYWWIFRPRRRGVRVVVESRGKFLMICPTYLKIRVWNFPGGGIKKGESVEDAAIREVREETGLQVGSPVALGSLTFTKEFKIDEITVLTAQISGGESPRIGDMLEIESVGWFEPDRFPPVGTVAREVFDLYTKRTH